MTPKAAGVAPSRLIRPRSRRTPGARSRYRACPSSYGRMPMLEGAPTTAIDRVHDSEPAVRRRAGRCRAAPASAAARRSRRARRRCRRRPAAAPAAPPRSSRAPTRTRASSAAGSPRASSRSRCACVTRNVVDSPTSKRRRSDSRRSLRERRAGARGLHAFGRAVDLPARAAHGFGRLRRAGSRSAAPPAAARRRRAHSWRPRNCGRADNSRSDRSSMSGSRW